MGKHVLDSLLFVFEDLHDLNTFLFARERYAGLKWTVPHGLEKFRIPLFSEGS